MSPKWYSEEVRIRELEERKSQKIVDIFPLFSLVFSLVFFNKVTFLFLIKESNYSLSILVPRSGTAKTSQPSIFVFAGVPEVVQRKKGGKQKSGKIIKKRASVPEVVQRKGQVSPKWYSEKGKCPRSGTAKM